MEKTAFSIKRHAKHDGFVSNNTQQWRTLVVQYLINASGIYSRLSMTQLLVMQKWFSAKFTSVDYCALALFFN